MLTNSPTAPNEYVCIIILTIEHATNLCLKGIQPKGRIDPHPVNRRPGVKTPGQAPDYALIACNSVAPTDWIPHCITNDIPVWVRNIVDRCWPYI